MDDTFKRIIRQMNSEKSREIPPEILAFKAARDRAFKSKEDTEETILGYKFEFELFRLTGFVIVTHVTRLSDGLSIKMRTSDALLTLWRLVEARNPPPDSDTPKEIRFLDRDIDEDIN